METKQLVALGLMAALVLTGGAEGQVGKAMSSNFGKKGLDGSEASIKPGDPNPYSKNDSWTLTDIIRGVRENAAYLRKKFDDNKLLVQFTMTAIFGKEAILPIEVVDEVMDFIYGEGDWMNFVSGLFFDGDDK